MSDPGSQVIKKLSSTFKGDGYRARAVRSTGLVLLNFGGENILRLASNIVLTRLLFPEAFGLMALVQVVALVQVMGSRPVLSRRAPHQCARTGVRCRRFNRLHRPPLRRRAGWGH